MTDLRALVDDATPSSAPDFDRVLARRDQRNRRRRAMVGGAAATALVVGASLVIVLGASNSDENPSPAPTPSPTQPISPTPTPVRADPPKLSYTWSKTPSQVVVRLPDRDVTLKTWLGCWWDPSGGLDCVEERPDPVAMLPDIGSPEAVEFWFGVKGWTFEASFSQLGTDCARGESAKTVVTGAHWFRLDPAGYAGDYQVDLAGYGPHADFKGVPTMMSFVWHTTTDGPVDQPTARVSHSDLEVSRVGFHPASATAKVTITDANGQRTTRRLPSAGNEPCTTLGSFYFQGDFDDPAIPKLGPRPYTYRVVLTLDGTPYVGTAKDDGQVTWTPALPAYTR